MNKQDETVALAMFVAGLIYGVLFGLVSGVALTFLLSSVFGQ